MEKYNTAVVSVYTGEYVDIEEVEPQAGLELLKKMYISRAESAPGKMNSNEGIGTMKVIVMKGQFLIVTETDKPGNYIANVSFTGVQGAIADIGQSGDFSLSLPTSKGSPGVGTLQVTDYGISMITGNVQIDFVKA